MHGLKAKLSADVRLSRLRALWDRHCHGSTLLLIGAADTCKLCRDGVEDQYHIIRARTRSWSAAGKDIGAS